MAWNPSPKVADAREIGRKWKKEQIVVLGIDRKKGTVEYAIYGRTKVLCDEAREFADAAFEAVVRALMERDRYAG